MNAITLRKQLICPHCWHEFPPESLRWISEHVDLMGDPKLGENFPRRFLPTRFDPQGNALDLRGFPCHRLACPKCHLGIPQGLLEFPPLFVSIIGSPSSGKSYLLASMTWSLRRTLPQTFLMDFADADALANQVLKDNEEQHFFNSNSDQLVAIRKTELQGDLYDVVQYGSQRISYPRPFIFDIQPLQGHPYYENHEQVSAGLCLYDNAGEHFLPGYDTTASPATRHLRHSDFLLFLFDPTQDVAFRNACRGSSNDPQITKVERTSRQETVLQEVANRIRQLSGLSAKQKHDKLLIVIVTKYDAWKSLVGNHILSPPWTQSAPAGLKLAYIEEISAKIRKLLLKFSPEVVNRAESFAKRVLFVPVSALGTSPELDSQGGLGIRPNNIQPMWVEVPLLYALTVCKRGSIRPAR